MGSPQLYKSGPIHGRRWLTAAWLKQKSDSVAEHEPAAVVIPDSIRGHSREFHVKATESIEPRMTFHHQ